MAATEYTRYTIQHDASIKVHGIEHPSYYPEISETDNGHKPDETTHDLKNEANRLKTFTNWPNSSISPQVLAKAGFYFLHRNDAVKCAYCGAEGHQWASGDDPLKDHETWSPNCPYLRSLNLPSTRDVPPNAEDVCGNSEYFPNSIPEDESYKLLRQIGIGKEKPSVYGSYSTLDSRLQTFREWPRSLKQKPDHLAEAGFFYKGIGDQTLCFHCGGGLKDWEDNDEPWEQHALWFPRCNFLILKKGEEFVKQVQSRFNAEDEQLPEASSSNNTPTKEEETVKTVECTSEKSSNSTDENNTALCKICYKNEVGIVFIPCGHVVTCVDCSHSLKDTCPVCRKKVDAKIRAFLS